MDTTEKAIIKGETVLLENIGETVDPVLDPLLGRNLIKKGRLVYITITNLINLKRPTVIKHKNIFN